MLRCTNENPCPVCGRCADGCLYSEDGEVAICVRTPEGAVKNTGNGWLHILKPGKFKPKPVKPKNLHTSILNWNLLNDAYTENLRYFYDDTLNIGHSLVDKVCRAWGVKPITLKIMNIGWHGDCFTFPVRNAEEKPIGLQRLYSDNSKRLDKGSKMGLFIPRLNWDDLPENWILYICEGLSDTATAIDMGLRAIGRLSCGTGKEHIINFCTKKKPSQIIVIADRDKPGVAGAKVLAKTLDGKNFDVKILLPEYKDLREWVKEDGQKFVYNKIISLTF